jgi:hypothetical protein
MQAVAGLTAARERMMMQAVAVLTSARERMMMQAIAGQQHHHKRQHGPDDVDL